MNHWTNPTRLAPIFACVEAETIACGGDGSGVVILRSASITEVASAFDAWQKEHSKDWWNGRSDRPDGSVVFFHDQEDIHFAPPSARDGLLAGLGQPSILMEVW